MPFSRGFALLLALSHCSGFISPHLGQKHTASLRRRFHVAATGEVPHRSAADDSNTAFSWDGKFYESNTMGVRRSLTLDDVGGRFHADTDSAPVLRASLGHFIRHNFVPSGKMSVDYYKYTAWRISQRFISATTNVFGTQALLMALGIKQSKLGIAAATTWVLKDGLGKISRVIWASRYGKKFDIDAKRWRFRSSLLFAAGNALEVFTYIVPPLFLITAAIANAMKQMAMLTSSSTRNAIYKSFARNTDNIGDITAKGESQIAIVDLLGLLAGIAISRVIGTSKKNIATVFSIFSLVDLFCVYNEIKSVVFDSLNYERASMVLEDINGMYDRGDSLVDATDIIKVRNARLKRGEEGMIRSPSASAQVEKLFLPAYFGQEMFVSWSAVQADISMLKRATDFFISDRKENFIVMLCKEEVSSLSVFKAKVGLDSVALLRRINGKPVLIRPQILLRENATNFHVFRALITLHRALHNFKKSSTPHKFFDADGQDSSGDQLQSLENVDKDYLLGLIIDASEWEKNNLRNIINGLRVAGWDMGKFSFGSILCRVNWGEGGYT
jgi:hypothetical protein